MSIMGALRRVTGGAAEVELTVENAKRGAKAKVTIDVHIGSAAVKAKRIYVKLRASETVDIPRYSVLSQPGQTGGSTTIRVTSDETVFSQEYVVAEAQELPSGSTQQFTAEIDIPAGALPTFDGKTIAMKWQALAGLDVAWSTDPSSGWKEFVVG